MPKSVTREHPAAGLSGARAQAPLPGKNAAALAQAFERAEERKVNLLKRADMLNGEQLAAELGLSRATVDNRRQEGKLLALEFGTKRGVSLPAVAAGFGRGERHSRELRGGLESTRSPGAVIALSILRAEFA